MVLDLVSPVLTAGDLINAHARHHPPLKTQLVDRPNLVQQAAGVKGNVPVGKKSRF